MTEPADSAMPATPASTRRWPPRLQRIGFGGDYNPEQWPREVWADDVRLMRAAHVTLATVGVFSWAMLEPKQGAYDFGWLDDVIEGLHGGGIGVCLATPTASPPAWLARAHPDSLPVDRDGVRLGIGSREHFCPNSAAYRSAAAGIAGRLAERYGEHPAVALWHVGNEFGSTVGRCHCDSCAAAFVGWLQQRYDDLAAVNAAWGTTFWGQRYSDWAQITPPRAAPGVVNPSQQLDYQRFMSDSFLACFMGERDVIREASPGVPITTNFMTTNCRHLDYWRWAEEVDVVSNDHYPTAADPENHLEVALAADLTRGLAGGEPWLLMETSASAVNWQPRNVARKPGELRRTVFSHLARGADGTLFFQWRQSRFGAEKFHSALVPQSGERGRVWQEVAALGADLDNLAEVRGSRVAAEAAVVWDYESMWATELEYRPSVDVTFRARFDAFYDALWRADRTVDIVAPTADLSGYPLVVVPSLYLTTAAASANLRRYVAGGGCLLVSFFSGIVDEHDAVHAGPYPGALRDVLGLWIDEFAPLRQGERVRLDDGSVGTVWSEAVRPAGADVVRTFADGPQAGGPALTRHGVGAGEAWYLSTALDTGDLRALLATLPAGRDASAALPEGVETVRRVGADSSYRFLINHTDEDVTAPGSGTDLLTGAAYDGDVAIPARGATVVRESRPAGA
jgi:beta-galactosidase